MHESGRRRRLAPPTRTADHLFKDERSNRRADLRDGPSTAAARAVGVTSSDRVLVYRYDGFHSQPLGENVPCGVENKPIGVFPAEVREARPLLVRRQARQVGEPAALDD